MNESMKAPLVSVVIPAYNQAEFVGEAIQSVLNQTYSNFEIVIVNDASTDHTSEVVRQFVDPRVKYIVHEKNQGLPSARNTGMRASAGEIIALLDADDFFHSDKLKAHVDFLSQHPEVGVSYNARFELNHSAKTIRELWRPPTSVSLKDLVLGFPFSPSDTVLRRDWAFNAGLFNPSMGSAEDTDFPCRLALAGCRFAGIDRALNYRRYHSGKGRKNLPGRLNDVERALEAVFADPRCPSEVLAIRGKAIKHHLMVIVSLALVQEEISLAHKFVRDLIQLDPAVLEGHPCELMDFLLMESIADEGLNHEQLLRKIIARLPAETSRVFTQYDWAVARGYLLKGVRAIIWDRPEDGQVHLSRAVELNAQVDGPLMQLLTHQMLNYEIEFGAEATKAILQKLASCLKEVGGWRWAHRLEGSYWVNRAFQDYRACKYNKVPKLVIRAVGIDPSYLRNRGVISILLHSMAGIVRQPMLKNSPQNIAL